MSQTVVVGSSSRALLQPHPFSLRARQPLPFRPCQAALKQAQRLRSAVVTAAADNKVASPSTTSNLAEADLVADNEFSITKISYGAILTPLGVGLLTYGFGAYFLLLPGADVAALLLIYGFPISLLGFALSYAQLKPVPCKTTKQAFTLRDTQMTDIQKQIREDTTRYRYGDEQHLEEALEKIFKVGKSGGLQRKFVPLLTGLREEVVDGKYTLALEFSSKLDQAAWDERQPKFQSFFGPGITAKLVKTDAGMDVLLTSDGSGLGRGGGEKKDVLPPLLPGLQPRRDTLNLNEP